MRIAFLCKRRYTGKDVIADGFGRLYEIPRQLALLNHDVRGFCLDYRGHSEGEWTHETAPGSLAWESHSLGHLRLPTLLGYPNRLLRRLRDFAPNVLIGASDIPHVALAAWLAKKLRTPCALDLYDNFEGYGQARIPGFVPALKHATRAADLVIAVSEPLKRKVEYEYARRGPVLVMPNAIDKAVFHPADRCAARERLGLPSDAALVGTAGGLYRSKGLAQLYAAWPRIAAARPDAHLVLAGPIESGFAPPQGKRVHYLGQLPHARVADLFNALDVGVVTVADSTFGRYCFPQKAYEMLACELPVVATNVGVMANMLAGSPHLLYPPDDASTLADAVLGQLREPVRIDAPIRDWAELVASIEPALTRLVADAQ